MGGANILATVVRMALPKFVQEDLTSQNGLSMHQEASTAVSTRLDMLNAAMENFSLAVMGAISPFKQLMSLKGGKALQVCRGPMAFGDSSFASMDGAHAV